MHGCLTAAIDGRHLIEHKAGRRATWEDSPAGWPRRWQINGDQVRTNRRPTAQWSRLEAGCSADSM